MATGAVDQKTRTSSKRESKPKSPKRWWQQILLYPAFAVALVTAGPQWIDKGRGLALGVKGGASDAEKQNRLWAKNAGCASLPFKGYLNPRNVTVDATICDSGDILVKAVTPENAQIYKWLALDDVVPTAGPGSVIPTAHAATLSAHAAPSARMVAKPTVRLAQFQVNVVCTRMDGRYLHRRIQTPQGCFDEVIDTYSGAVVSRNPAPCVAQC
jgi:hypothetical protein